MLNHLEFVLEHHELIAVVSLHINFLDQLEQLRLLLLLTPSCVAHHQDPILANIANKLLVIQDGSSLLNHTQPHVLVLPGGHIS